MGTAYHPLVNQFQPELHDPRLRRALNPSHRRRTDISHGIRQIRVVEQVEELRAGLHFRPFRDPEAAECREVEEVTPRSDQGVLPAIAECAERDLCVRGRIEVPGKKLVARSSGVSVRIADEVRALRSRAGQRLVASACDVERRAALDGHDAVPLPSAEDSLARARLRSGSFPHGSW